MENCVQIGRGDLKVWLAEPGKRYARSRFDWAGFIPQAELCGKTFCTTESYPGGPPSTGGEGFCNEFKADDATMGWDESDRFFLKPGVGMLEKINDKPYFFFTDYKVVKPFPCTMQANGDHADFYSGAIPLKGIAYAMHKHIAVIDNMLLITTTLTNEGEKPLRLREYNHNFLSLGGYGAHSQATLTINKDYKNENETPGLIMNEDDITFTDDLKGSFMIKCDNPVAYAPMRWELRDGKAGLRVQEWGDFDVTDFYAWGTRRVISPEIFGDFPVEPGKSRSWTRMWKFSPM
ncbi:MAG: hypothetical protein FWE90_08550 [Defluviitaleaceae bacterium]|nr:hypothetical protein [Defluviitaleaceae bacterium]